MSNLREYYYNIRASLLQAAVLVHATNDLIIKYLVTKMKLIVKIQVSITKSLGLKKVSKNETLYYIDT